MLRILHIRTHLDVLQVKNGTRTMNFFPDFEDYMALGYVNITLISNVNIIFYFNFCVVKLLLLDKLMNADESFLKFSWLTTIVLRKERLRYLFTKIYNIETMSRNEWGRQPF